MRGEQRAVAECLRLIRDRAEKVVQWINTQPIGTLPPEIEGAIHVIRALADEATGGELFLARVRGAMQEANE